MSRGGLGLAAIVLLALAVTAVLAQWMQSVRPFGPDGDGRLEFVVTSPGDRGPGTLREAIFGANSAPSRARIVIRTPGLVVRTPLPPLVNPDGVQLVADGVAAEIDARGLAEAPVLDVRAEGTVVRGIAVVGSPFVAFAIRAAGVLLDSVRVEGSEIAVLHVEGAGLVVEGSLFRSNGVGLRLTGRDPDVQVRASRFVGHREAAVWAVGPPDEPGALSGRGLVITRNAFEQDRMALVLGNRAVTVTDNDFIGSRDVGVYVAGEGAHIRGNRVLRGAGHGILASGALGAEIADNETDGNRAVGILVNSSRNTVVARNRSYRNGYGFVAVFGDARSPDRLDGNTAAANDFDGFAVVGASPVLTANRVIGNRLAGLRILDYQPRAGPRVTADPFLGENSFRGNGLDELIRGVYLEPPPVVRE